MYYIQKISFPPPPNSLVYIFIRILVENDFFPSLNIFEAFKFDVNVVNFVYYGKTRMALQLLSNTTSRTL